MSVPGAASGVPGKGSTSRVSEEEERAAPDPCAVVTAAATPPPATARQAIAPVSAEVDPACRIRPSKLRPTRNLRIPSIVDGSLCIPRQERVRDPQSARPTAWTDGADHLPATAADVPRMLPRELSASTSK